jgi:hypothetical protein
MLMCLVPLQLGEKAGGPQIRECKLKLEETERQMRHKIQQLKRAKQDRSVGDQGLGSGSLCLCMHVGIHTS